MTDRHKLDQVIAVIVEGGAEAAILDILLDYDKLIFRRDDILEGRVLRTRNARTFESTYLVNAFPKGGIVIYRILDSHKEEFRISNRYRHITTVVNVVTAPEIEMLMILLEKKYEEYKKRHFKPSEYCKTVLKMKRCKEYSFVKEYYSDYEKLIASIEEYHMITSKKKGELTLKELLKVS